MTLLDMLREKYPALSNTELNDIVDMLVDTFRYRSGIDFVIGDARPSLALSQDHLNEIASRAKTKDWLEVTGVPTTPVLEQGIGLVWIPPARDNAADELLLVDLLTKTTVDDKYEHYPLPEKPSNIIEQIKLDHSWPTKRR